MNKKSLEPIAAVAIAVIMACGVGKLISVQRKEDEVQRKANEAFKTWKTDFMASNGFQNKIRKATIANDKLDADFRERAYTILMRYYDGMLASNSEAIIRSKADFINYFLSSMKDEVGIKALVVHEEKVYEAELAAKKEKAEQERTAAIAREERYREESKDRADIEKLKVITKTAKYFLDGRD